MALQFSHLYFPLSFLITSLYMKSTLEGKAQDFFPLFRVYANGTVYRYAETKYVPPSNNSQTEVQSKDVSILPENNVSVRLFLPKISEKGQKFPLLIYIHGGGFCVESAFSPMYDSYLHSLTAAANVVAISINYRLAPEHPIPCCYHDSWAVMKWAVTHVHNGQGTEPWLKEHADFSRVFLAGDSAGANIAHDMMVGASEGRDGLNGVRLVGMALMNPFLGNGKPDPLYSYLCPTCTRLDDPRLNPAADKLLLSRLNCSKILICTASKDFLRDRALTYYEAMKKSGWKGEVELKETEGEGHTFHLLKPTSEKAKIVMKWVADFLV